ncbi:hypothetical protein GGI42DRAFT_131002 [Trichoderma sp. SZMC 28013]
MCSNACPSCSTGTRVDCISYSVLPLAHTTPHHTPPPPGRMPTTDAPWLWCCATIQVPSLVRFAFPLPLPKYIRTLALASPHELSTPQIIRITKHNNSILAHQTKPFTLLKASHLNFATLALKPSTLDHHQLTYTGRRLQPSSTTPTIKLLTAFNKPSQCLLSDLLTFLPARVPHPADLFLLCPNESRARSEEISLEYLQL